MEEDEEGPLPSDPEALTARLLSRRQQVVGLQAALAAAQIHVTQVCAVFCYWASSARCHIMLSLIVLECVLIRIVCKHWFLMCPCCHAHADACTHCVKLTELSCSYGVSAASSICPQPLPCPAPCSCAPLMHGASRMLHVSLAQWMPFSVPWSPTSLMTSALHPHCLPSPPCWP
jgi:hypothetical protein